MDNSEARRISDAQQEREDYRAKALVMSVWMAACLIIAGIGFAMMSPLAAVFLALFCIVSMLIWKQ
jgi:hypothetical protein